jgi:hypothetical protein
MNTGFSITHDAPASSTNVDLRTVNPLLPDTCCSTTQISDSFMAPNLKIVDGQHRLSAIAELQCSIKPVPSKLKIDVGRRRKKR